MKGLFSEKASLFISALTLVLLIHYMSQPKTVNLNSRIGWGFGMQEYYGMALLVLLVISIIFLINSRRKQKHSQMNAASMKLNAISIMLVVYYFFSFLI